MAQEVGERGYQPDDSGDGDRRGRSSVWPWIALAILVLIVILLLWIFWRQPPKPTVTVIKKTSEIPVVVPEPRPEPIVPTVVASSTETLTVPLVPDVLGYSKSSAVRALEGAGYVVSSSQVYSTSRASGLVVGQNPGGGTPLELGGRVAITVSVSAPATRDAKMPQVVGLSRASAETKIKNAGLVPTVLWGAGGKSPGTVFSQWPAAGEVVPEGSEGFMQVQMPK